jgi:hypothetical protein
MDLEAAASYLIALAVPLWLVGEYVVHAWRAPRSLEDEGKARVEDRKRDQKLAPRAPMSGFESYRRSV